MTITAPTTSAPAYYLHRALAGRADEVLPRADGVEYVFQIAEKDVAMWPELTGYVRISFWRRASGEVQMIGTLKVEGGVIEQGMGPVPAVGEP